MNVNLNLNLFGCQGSHQETGQDHVELDPWQHEANYRQQCSDAFRTWMVWYQEHTWGNLMATTSFWSITCHLWNSDVITSAFLVNPQNTTTALEVYSVVLRMSQLLHSRTLLWVKKLRHSLSHSNHNTPPSTHFLNNNQARRLYHSSMSSFWAPILIRDGPMWLMMERCKVAAMYHVHAALVRKVS